MAATTPYQQNDYTAVSNFRPYQLPVNDIFKALQAQNQFWEDGARRVKSVYDNALNLKLSLEPNREIRKRFMEEAEKQLTKLSSMDLSDPSIQRQGFDIFKPLFQDEGVMSDDQATRWIDDVQSDIQRARENNNGKDYADTNAMVAMEGVYEFKTAKDRNAGKGYLANKRSYTPYYDPSKEIMEITKNCKGPTISSTKPGTSTDMYLHTEEASGASPLRLKNCLNAALSQHAKDQIGIDGYASYMTNNRTDHPEGKNYQALRDDYLVHNTGAMKDLQQNIGDMDGKIVAYQNAYNTSKDSRYLDMKKAAEQAKSQYLDQGKNLTNAFNQISAGNLDFIKKNYGELSERLYTNKQLSLVSEAFRTDNTVDKYSADAVRLQQQRLVYDESKTKSGYQHDEDMENLRSKNDMKIEALRLSLKGKKLDEKGNPIEELIPTNPAFTEKDKLTNGFEDFIKEKDTVASAIDGVNGELFNTLKRKYPKEMEAYSDSKAFFAPGPNGISPALSFLDSNGRIQDDTSVQDWSQQSAILTNKLGLLNAFQKTNDAEIEQAVPRASVEQKLAKMKPISLNGLIITPQDINDALLGRPTKSGLVTRPGSSFVDTEGNIHEGTPDWFIVNNGGITKLSSSSFANKNGTPTDFNKLRLQVNDANGSYLKSTLDKRNEVYNRSMLVLRPDVYADANNTDKNDATRNNIRAAMGPQFNLDDIQIIKKDPTTGYATISIKGNDKTKISSDDAKIRMSQITGVDGSPEFKESSNEAVIRVQSPYLIDQRTVSNPLGILQLNLEKLTLAVNNPLSTYARIQPGQLITSLPISTKAFNGTDFQVDIIRTQNGAKYEVLSKQKNDVISADGTITQKKGMYYSTGQSFSSTNQLLEYLNGTTQNTK